MSMVLEETNAARTYRRLVDAVESGREITLPDDQLILAAREAVELGHLTTARLALNEYAERRSEVAA